MDVKCLYVFIKYFYEFLVIVRTPCRKGFVSFFFKVFFRRSTPVATRSKLLFKLVKEVYVHDKFVANPYKIEQFTLYNVSCKYRYHTHAFNQ